MLKLTNLTQGKLGGGEIHLMVPPSGAATGFLLASLTTHATPWQPGCRSRIRTLSPGLYCVKMGTERVAGQLVASMH